MDSEIILQKQTELTSYEDPDIIKTQLMDNILQNSVAVNIGNFIILPPIEEPKVTNIERVENLLKFSKIADNYVITNITVDNSPIVLLTHISRICDENISPSMIPYNIEHFNTNELKTVFKNEFPALITNIIKKYIDYKIENGLITFKEAEEFKFISNNN